MFLGIVKGELTATDEELWNSFRAGKKKAISELFLRYHADLYRYGLKINQNQDVVHDSIQELFLKLWSKKDVLDHVNAVKKYLIVSLRRIIISQLRTYEARERRENEYFGQPYQSYFNAEDKIIKSETDQERKRLLREAVATLTERQREILFLKYFEGFENREIAEIMDLSYQRVRNLLHEAIVRLREYSKNPM